MSAAASAEARVGSIGNRSGPHRVVDPGVPGDRSGGVWIARRDERILLQASARELKDIGLDRCDIRRAVRGELWRPR